MAMGMLVVQGFAVGLQILSRIILTRGTFIFALMAYRQIVGAVCVAPLAFYYDRFVLAYIFRFLQTLLASEHKDVYDTLCQSRGDIDVCFFGHCRSHFKKLTRLACFWLFMVALTG